MYRDIQEPMLSAASEQFGRNPFAGLVENNSGSNGMKCSSQTDVQFGAILMTILRYPHHTEEAVEVHSGAHIFQMHSFLFCCSLMFIYCRYRSIIAKNCIAVITTLNIF
jgi:hypothetical protein